MSSAIIIPCTDKSYVGNTVMTHGEQRLRREVVSGAGAPHQGQPARSGKSCMAVAANAKTPDIDPSVTAGVAGNEKEV